MRYMEYLSEWTVSPERWLRLGYILGASENGGRIDVNYYYSGNDDTEPVYNEYENDVSAYFTEDEIDYNIYGTDTGREPVEEVVNSIK